jgi:hypothetical protein
MASPGSAPGISTRAMAAGERTLSVKKHLFLLICCLVPASLALADGSGPARKMTVAEAASANKVRDAIQNSLPKAPEGYAFTFTRVSDFDEGTLPEAMGAGEMFRMSYSANYALDRSLLAERTQSTLMDKAKGTPEQQAKLAELDAKVAELKEARDAAKDRVAKETIRAQIKSVNAEAEALRDEIMAQFQAWMASGGAAATSQEIDDSLPADEVSISITVNAGVSVLDKATAYPIEGFPLAFEQAEGCQGSDTYCITILLGPFVKLDKLSGYTRYKLPEKGTGVPTDARGIALVIGGPKEKAETVRTFLRGIDLAKLKAVLS